MQILFSVYSTSSNSLENGIVLSKNVGFDGVDYIATMKDLFFPPEDILYLSKKYKVKVKSLHIPLPLILYTPEILSMRIKKLTTYFPDCERFNFHLSGFLNPLSRNIKQLEKFIEFMKIENIQLSCESNPNELFFLKYFPKETYDPILFAEFCIKHNIPINLDTSHIGAWNYDIVLFYKKYHENINLMHLSDMTKSKQHLPFRKGILPLMDLFKAMNELSYKGVVVFEISTFPKGTSQKDKQKELKKNVAMLKSIVFH